MFPILACAFIFDHASGKRRFASSCSAMPRTFVPAKSGRLAPPKRRKINLPMHLPAKDDVANRGESAGYRLAAHLNRVRAYDVRSTGPNAC